MSHLFESHGARLAGVAALVLGVTACGGELQQPEPTAAPEPVLMTQEAPLASVPGVTFWPRPSPRIPVCFMNPDWEFPTEKRQIKEAVENTWMRVANVRIVGWETCPFNSSQKFVTVHVTSNDAGSGGSAVSGMSALRTREQSVTTRPSVHIAFSNDPARHTLGRLEYLAVHEFGHILGFAHEQDRSDNPISGSDTGTPDYCRNRGPTNVTTYHSGYDRDSIMNYCNKYWNTRGYLSPADVLGVQRVYGRKAIGSIVSFDGRCVDVPYGQNADWTRLWTYECADQNQMWHYWPMRGVFEWVQPNSQLSGRAMDVEWGSTAPGTPVQLYSMNGGGAQEWWMPNMEIKGLGGMCLSADGFSNGARVRLAECNGSAQQKFTYHQDRSLRTRDPWTGAERCLDADTTTGLANGTIVQLWDCNGQPQQRWTIGAIGSIQAYDNSPFCLDADTHDLNQFTGENGKTSLQLWMCALPFSYSPPLHQQFNLSGQLRGLGDNCLDVAGAGRANGTPIISYPCHGGMNQTWDYYF
jgi:hypothetical protein